MNKDDQNICDIIRHTLDQAKPNLLQKSAHDLSLDFTKSAYHLAQLEFHLGNVKSSQSKDTELAISRCRTLETMITDYVMTQPIEFQKDYMIKSLKLMQVYFEAEESLHQEPQSIQSIPCLYRSFDQIDRILHLDYSIDKKVTVDQSSPERLYQGAGVGVQSGYSNILLALDKLDLTTNSLMIDLGAGFGRVGLVSALLNPDIEFIGYEFVPHRVEVANQSSELFELEDILTFKTQDLSSPSFRIPDGDIFYLYDPFTDDTYLHIMDQIDKIADRKDIQIVTKGNAKKWVCRMAEARGWSQPIVLDSGNVCIFKSPSESSDT